MRFKRIVAYSSPAGRVDFIPVSDMPGFTHRVAINNELKRDWLGRGFRPNTRAAKFFLQKHAAPK